MIVFFCRRADNMCGQISDVETSTNAFRCKKGAFFYRLGEQGNYYMEMRSFYKRGSLMNGIVLQDGLK